MKLILLFCHKVLVSGSTEITTVNVPDICIQPANAQDPLMIIRSYIVDSLYHWKIFSDTSPVYDSFNLFVLHELTALVSTNKPNSYSSHTHVLKPLETKKSVFWNENISKCILKQYMWVKWVVFFYLFQYLQLYVLLWKFAVCFYPLQVPFFNWRIPKVSQNYN